MEEKGKSNQHDKNLNTEARLNLVLEEFHQLPGMLSRWKLDSDKAKACLNLIVGTTAASRALLQSHLNFHKWQQSAFTAELLRSTRWLLGASPRYAKDGLKVILTVNKEIQEKFLANHIMWFQAQAKKCKPSGRSKLRPSQAEWDKAVDYTCIMHAVQLEAASVFADQEDQEVKNRVHQQIQEAYMARPKSRGPQNIWYQCFDL